MKHILYVCEILKRAEMVYMPEIKHKLIDRGVKNIKINRNQMTITANDVMIHFATSRMDPRSIYGCAFDYYFDPLEIEIRGVKYYSFGTLLRSRIKVGAKELATDDDIINMISGVNEDA